MTTCKQPKHQENSTPLPSCLQERGRQDWSLNQSKIPVVSPTKRGKGNSYLYLLQKSIAVKSSGFTIIECLLAIIMVSIMLTAVAPVIVLSVATRVQARRVEQATIAGRNYIDAVQSDPNLKPAATVPLYEAQTIPGTTNKRYIGSARDIFASATAPPQRVLTCPDDRGVVAGSIYPYCDNGTTGPYSLYCVDNDGGGCTSNSNKDFIVQAFRSVKATAPGVLDPTDDGSGGYVLGVRVYRADGFDGATPLQTTRGNYDKKVLTKVATYTGGKGNQFAPLAEFTTEMRPQPSEPGDGAMMKSLCDRLGGCTNSTTTPTP